MTTKTTTNVVSEITENIRTAFGIANGGTRWREIYPCAFAVGLFRATYRDYGYWQYTDWVDMADLFAATHSHQQQS